MIKQKFTIKGIRKFNEKKVIELTSMIFKDHADKSCFINRYNTPSDIELESLTLMKVITNRHLLMDLKTIFGLTLTAMGLCTISSVTFAHLSQAREEKDLIERPELYIRWCDPDRTSEAIGDINCIDYMRFFEPPYIERSLENDR